VCSDCKTDIPVISGTYFVYGTKQITRWTDQDNEVKRERWDSQKRTSLGSVPWWCNMIRRKNRAAFRNKPVLTQRGKVRSNTARSLLLVPRLFNDAVRPTAHVSRVSWQKCQYHYLKQNPNCSEVTLLRQRPEVVLYILLRATMVLDY
jgi:hypothetical protein